MITNRRDAEAAAALLDLVLSDDAPITDADVNTEYRRAAKAAHPDGGGSLEAFARVDHAKHVLLNWLKQQAKAPGAVAADCKICGGAGNIKVQHGFRGSLRRQCPACRGSGDANYDHDDKAGGDS